jgi:hypothetical protein
MDNDRRNKHISLSGGRGVTVGYLHRSAGPLQVWPFTLHIMYEPEDLGLLDRQYE